MEQSDLAKFFSYSDSVDRVVLSCRICNDSGWDIKAYKEGKFIDLLTLMEDAAAHFAQVHRKSNDGS